MQNNLSKKIAWGKSLIERGKKLGKDTRLIEARVMALQRRLDPTSEAAKQAVLDGICKGCFHLGYDNYKPRGKWAFFCRSLKRKLNVTLNSCSVYKSNSDGFAELLKEMRDKG